MSVFFCFWCGFFFWYGDLFGIGNILIKGSREIKKYIMIIVGVEVYDLSEVSEIICNVNFCYFV